MTRCCHAVLLVATLGLSAAGCKDSVSVSEQTVEVPLSSLTITPGTLQPTFSSNTTSYTVEVSTTVSTVTVIAIPRDSTTTLSINGIDTNPGQGRPITLSSSGPTTPITIVLTSQNGLESTYNILVRKVDNTLSALSVTPGPLAPTFNPGTFTYQVDVASDINSVTVVATKADSHAVMSGSVTAGAGVTTGQATIPLNGPGSSIEISIVVGVPNGETKTYRITVNRAASGNNNLTALTVTPPGSFPPPGFSPSTLNYTVNVATNINRVDVTATKSDINAVMAIDSITVPAGTASGSALNIPLGGPGTPTTVSIVVTAQNGSPKTYSITVNRAASGNNNLSGLTVASGTSLLPLSPPFISSTQEYAVNVASQVTDITVTATLEDPRASMTIAGQGISSGQPRNISLLAPPPSSTEIEIIVIAQDTSQKPYRLTVSRAAPSNDANLSNLSVTSGSLDQPFNPNIFTYAVINVPTGDTVVIVTAVKSDPNSTMSALGSVISPPGTPTGTVPVILGTTVAITVIAQDAVTSNTYNITFNPTLPPP